MLSFLGWLNFLSIFLTITIGCGFGSKLIYESKKRKIRLLFVAGLSIIFMSLIYLGVFVDFIVIFLTGKNLNNKALVAILNMMWVGPITVALAYVGGEIIFPKYKKYMMIIYSIAAVLLELFLFLDPLGSILVTDPQNVGEISYSVGPRYGSPFIIVATFTQLSSIILLGSGFLYKAYKSTGLIKRKYLLLSISFIIYSCSTFLFTIFDRLIGFTILNLFVLLSFYLLYLGLREETEKVKLPKKEIKVEGDIFRISRYKKEDLTEEEVSISKERKICLVCKGKAGGYNIFLCTECESFYCAKCARALEDLENACWVCGEAIDKAKPIKSFEKKDEVEIEISEKLQKKPIQKSKGL